MAQPVQPMQPVASFSWKSGKSVVGPKYDEVTVKASSSVLAALAR